MKLLTQQVGQGPAQRCDARCYNARLGGHCDCICGGRNHAVGVERALQNVREIFLGQNVEGKPTGKGIPKVTRAAERAMERADLLKRTETVHAD